MLVIEVIHNLTLIVTISVVYELLHIVPEGSSRLRRLVAGALFGFAAVFGMMAPMQFAPGIIYDGRSILVAVAGLMTGATGGSVAAIIAAAYRIYLGGAGAVAGVAVIVSSAALGVAAYYLKQRSQRWSSVPALGALGFLVHAVMLLWQLLFLPETVRGDVLRTVGPVILLGYPVAFVIVSRLLIERETARRVAREKLRSEELYRALFEDTHVVMLAIDPEDGRILRANSAAEKFYGWSKAELTVMYVSDINTASPAEVTEAIRLARDAQEEQFQFRHRLADGSVRDVAVWSGRATVGDREILHSVVFDITERKRAERERDLMSLGMDYAALGVMRIREDDGTVEMVNRKAAALLGYRQEELVGMRVFDFDPGMNQEAWLRHRQRVRNLQEYTFETTHRRRDGTEYPAEVTVAYVITDGVEYSYSFFQDISERKRTQQRIVASLREKESLLQEVHHRVKNNLAVISSLVSLQLGAVQTHEEALQAMAKTRDRINTMGEVHNNLDSSDDFSGVDFCSFLKNRAQSLSYSYSDYRNIRIGVECAECRLDIATAVPLGLIVNELVINAYKHAFPPGQEGRVWITVVADGEALLLTVRDNGRGLTASEGGGTEGMGFQLVRLLAEQIDGEFEIMEEEGTRVQIRFPRWEKQSR